MENLTELYSKHPNHDVLSKLLKSSKKILVKGMHTSALSFFISSDKQLNSRPVIVVMDNEEDAAYTYNDFQSAEKNRDVFFWIVMEH